MQFKSKFPNAETTIFSIMTELAEQLQALNLSQGFPDFSPPQALLDAFQNVPNELHQYASGIGIPALRQQVAKQFQDLHQTTIDANTEVTITAGATIAIFSAIQAMVHPDEEVIIFDPSYDTYAPSVKMAGAKSVHIALQAPHFRVDWQQVKDAINPKTRMIIVNTPHNPTGTIWSKQDWLNLIDIVKDTNIVVLSDEVYEHLVFDDATHYSVMDFPELRERAFAIGSFGKTFHVTGWRTGYCVATPKLMREFRQVLQNASFCAVHPCQVALAQFMQQQPNHILELGDFYQQKRDFFLKGIKDSKFNSHASQGTYFQLLDYSNIRDDFTDVEMCQWLAREHKIVSIPISVFYQKAPQNLRLLRFCFAKKETTLQQAFEILNRC